ncbi:hypothetical protein UPYG_G00140610 [Umbra pygmaea]|uniref:Uncharacterized protein n=1 Tax=Umbra pygmaea TaxID=75934 RepID=A0ABD0WV86_UMBPY
MNNKTVGESAATTSWAFPDSLHWRRRDHTSLGQCNAPAYKVCLKSGHLELETLGLTVTHRGGSLELRQRPRSENHPISRTILQQRRSTNASAEGPAKKISTANDAIPEYTTNTENYKH